MRRWNKIITRLIIGIIFLSGEFACGQVYQTGNLGGGLNLLDDSTNIAPNEALVMTNLVLDMPNVMSSRPGFSVLNSTAIDTSQDINEIYIYEPYSGTRRMVIATNGGIYIMPSLGDPGAVDWDTLKMGWTGDSLSVLNGSILIRDLGNADWWWAKVSSGDSIEINGVKYMFAPSSDVDTLGRLGENYAGATDTVASYVIYKTTTGNVSFTQIGEKLYICDSEEFPLVYDDTSFVFVALIDSGRVTDTTALTGEFKYNHGRVRLPANSYWVIGDSAADWGLSYVQAGYYYTDIRDINHADRGVIEIRWTAIIDSVDTTGSSHKLRLTEVYPGINSITYWNNYEIVSPLANCVADLGWAVEDTNKNWMDVEYGTEYLQSFYVVNWDRGFRNPGDSTSAFRQIYCNEINTFSIPQLDTIDFNDTDRYYIFSRIPSPLDNNQDSLYKEFPYFEQVFSYSDLLYGFGHDRTEAGGPFGYLHPQNVNYSRLWYSAIGKSRNASIMHRYIKPNYNFDIDVSENVSLMFRLRGRAYIASNNSIWSFTGIPSFGDGGGDLYLEKIISNNGIPDIDNWAKATEEYGYFANYDGIFRFNGIRAKNISYNIDRAVKQYSSSECVIVYQSDRLYVSYPDSGVTFIYREPFEKWYGPLNFGMTCAYAPVDTDIVYFGNPDYLGYVFYYPNGLNYDVAPDNDTLAIAWTYESGWQSLTDGPWTSKRLLTGYFPANLSDTFSVDIFADFATVTADTFTWYPGGSSAHRFDNLSSVGDYFKVKIYGTTMQGVVIRPYRIEYQEADMREGN